jgi:hypothetical protein
VERAGVRRKDRSRGTLRRFSTAVPVRRRGVPAHAWRVVGNRLSVCSQRWRRRASHGCAGGDAKTQIWSGIRSFRSQWLACVYINCRMSQRTKQRRQGHSRLPLRETIERGVPPIAAHPGPQSHSGAQYLFGTGYRTSLAADASSSNTEAGQRDSFPGDVLRSSPRAFRAPIRETIGLKL